MRLKKGLPRLTNFKVAVKNFFGDTQTDQAGLQQLCN